MTRKGKAITLSLQPHQKASLEALAAAYDILWGNRPNISQLVKAIADGELKVAPNNDWSDDRIQMLDRVRKFLVDAGQREEAIALAELLLERSEISDPLRQEIQNYIDRPAYPWRIDIDRFIQQQQPFGLTYQDAAGRTRDFTIRYAEITTHEDRQYLDCWCEETEENQDIPPLIHNWCLRLDRIPEEASVAKVDGVWHPGLDRVLVEMHLFDGLVLAYRSKSNADVENALHPELDKTRRVVRKVSNTFWFFREVRRYGPDCEIISPPEVRDRFIAQLRKQVSRYGLGI